MGVHPIILCGGSGSRLWPASTPLEPKPFIDLLDGPSLFQRTVTRVGDVPGAHPPLIVAGASHGEQARAQLSGPGRDGVILTEPSGRDSGPALLAAALWISRTDPMGIAVAVASDHHIPDDGAFAAAVIAALPAAQAGEIVTFGVRPDSASDAYGYIRVGEPLGGGVSRVAAFIEKPDSSRAAVLLAEGCLWNSGNFVFRVDRMIEEASKHAPEALAAVRRAVDCAVEQPGGWRMGAAFATAPAVSIDVAIMERTDRAAVLPIAYVWSDVGSWDAVWAQSARDAQGNAISGVAVVSDSRDCLVRSSDGGRVVVVGGQRLAVVARGGEVLVTAMGRSGALKTALAALDAADAGARGAARAGDLTALMDASSRLKGWLFERALPLWWCYGADHARGGFHERLGLDLVPADLDRRVLVQARQTHVYATAGLMGWPGPWRSAIDHGLDFLDSRYRRSDGLYRRAVRPDGSPADETARLYDQAFVLLALATSARAMPHRSAELEGRASRLADAIASTFALADGGFRAEEQTCARLADPIMHLFEAVLAWSEGGDAGRWRPWADDIAAFFLTRMHDREGARIAEVFGPDWRPATEDAGRRLEPGHHFEWAWLIERWGRGGDHPLSGAAARGLFASGERGVDPASGLVVDALLDDFTSLKTSSRLWPQTERVKTALLLAADPGEARAGRIAAALSAAEAIEAYLDTPHAGLWRDEPGPAPRSGGEAALASSFYHIIGAIDALQSAGPGLLSRTVETRALPMPPR